MTHMDPKSRKLLWLLPLLILGLTACGMHRDPDRIAESFFDRGESKILKSLKKNDATSAQLERAREILTRSKPDVTRDLAQLFRQHRGLMLAVTSGKDSSTLLDLEGTLHRAHEQTLQRIGKMHEELRGAVGEKTWQAASADMERDMARHLRAEN